MRDTVDGINEKAWDRAMSKQPVTHYIADDSGRRLDKALCGRLVSHKEHSNEPTCATCATRAAEEEAIAADLLAKERAKRETR